MQAAERYVVKKWNCKYKKLTSEDRALNWTMLYESSKFSVILPPHFPKYASGVRLGLNAVTSHVHRQAGEKLFFTSS